MTTDETWEGLRRLAYGTRVRTLVITGGEPVSQAKPLLSLLDHTQSHGWRTEMETSGAVPLGPLAERVDHITVSPKTHGSGMHPSRSLKPAILEQLAALPHVVWKFVIETEQDLDDVDRLVEQYRLNPVMLMPQATTADELIAGLHRLLPHALAQGYSLSSRLQVLLWGDQRGH